MYAIVVGNQYKWFFHKRFQIADCGLRIADVGCAMWEVRCGISDVGGAMWDVGGWISDFIKRCLSLLTIFHQLFLH
jgi:hypothetical protein